MTAVAVGTVSLTKPGSWLIEAKCTLTLAGTAKSDLTTGLPYLTMTVAPGTHGSYTVLPSTIPLAPILWTWMFVHEVTSTTVTPSSPEVLTFTSDSSNLGAMTLTVALNARATFIATLFDSSAPTATQVTVNPGSKLQILRQANR